MKRKSGKLRRWPAWLMALVLTFSTGAMGGTFEVQAKTNSLNGSAEAVVASAAEGIDSTNGETVSEAEDAQTDNSENETVNPDQTTAPKEDSSDETAEVPAEPSADVNTKTGDTTLESVTDSGINITTEFAADTFNTDADPELKVQDLQEEDALAIAEKATDGNEQILAVKGVDISFAAENEELQPQSEQDISVKMEFPTSLVDETKTENVEYILIHNHDDQADIIQDAEIQDTAETPEVKFTSDSFSEYVLAAVVPEENADEVDSNTNSDATTALTSEGASAALTSEDATEALTAEPEISAENETEFEPAAAEEYTDATQSDVSWTVNITWVENGNEDVTTPNYLYVSLEDPENPGTTSYSIRQKPDLNNGNTFVLSKDTLSGWSDSYIDWNPSFTTPDGWSCSEPEITTDENGNKMAVYTLTWVQATVTDNGITYTVDIDDENKTATITGITDPENDTDVTIPQTVKVGENEYTVTAVDINVGYSDPSITHVTALSFPNTVTELDVSFRKFSNLKSLTIPGSVKTFTSSLQYMGSLEKLTFEEGVETISRNSMVYEDSNLTTINLPSTLKSLTEPGTFSKCGITSIELPDGLTWTEGSQFSRCDKLTSIKLPSSITTIPSSTFDDCESLEEVTGLGNVTNIGNSAFSGIKDVSLPDLDFSKISSIGDRAFYYSSINQLADSPDLSNVTEVGEYAFYGSNLGGDIDLSSLTSINNGAFAYNDATSFTLSDQLESIGDYAFAYNFYNLTGDIVLPDSLTTLGTGAYCGCFRIVSMTIPSGVKEIPANCLANTYGSDFKTSLTSVLIKNAEEDITLDGTAFSGNSNLYDENGALRTAVGDSYQDNTVVFTKANKEVTGTIYLNGAGGNDENDGTTADTAVKTFAKAEELAEAALKEGAENNVIVYVTGTVSVTDEQTWTSKEGITYKRGDSFTDALVNVNGGILSLSDITVAGNNKTTGVKGSLVTVSNNGTLNLNSRATLENNRFGTNNYALGGAVYLKDSSRLNMNKDSTIQGNRACFGGGIYGTGTSTVINLNGGTIQNNQAVADSDGRAYGGGVASWYGATINLTGTSVTGNTSASKGGGISLGIDMSMDYEVGVSTLNMTGGSISNNTANDLGGGIYISAGGKGGNGLANVTGGSVSGNTARAKGDYSNSYFAGGGIYVNGATNMNANGVLNLKNAIISSNTANLEGGGYAACPSSDTHIYVTDGAAITDNKAASARDIYVLSNHYYGAHSGDPEYEISPFMLGGQPYNWKDDEGNEIALNKLTGKLVNDELTLTAGNSADKAANDKAAVTISNNTSGSRGGGIGSNGTVVIGTDDGKNEVSFRKTWNVPEGTRLPSSIQVNLYRVNEEDGKYAEQYVGYMEVKPDEDGIWSGTFANLPKGSYTVKEEAEGYVSTVSGNVSDNFTIINTKATTVKVNKVWDDEDNQDGIRPDSVTVTLYANGDKTDQTLTLRSENDWSGEFTDLPLLDKNGNEIAYTIQENSVENYTTEISGDTASGFTITNTHTPELTSISGTKVWDDADNQDGERPDKVTVRLLANGTEVDHKTISAEDGWSFTFDNLAKNENGSAIVYSVTEDAVENYSVKVTGNAADGFTVTNTHTPGQISVTVTKNWVDDDNQDGQRPASVTVKLLADGKETGKTLTLSDDNNWSDAFTGLDVNKDGQAITYSVEEYAVNGYTAKLSGDAEEGFVITNTHTSNQTSVKVTKTWDDSNDKDGVRPKSITVHLFANGKEVDKATITKDENWTYEFTDLPVNENGSQIAYTVTEDKVDGYTTTINGYVITNTHKSESKQETPEMPSDNKKPGNNPQNPTPSDSANTSTTTGSVKTGDSTPIGLYAGLLAAAVAVLVIMLVVRNRKTRRS